MAAPIPPIDFSRFQWRRCPDDPGLHIREASGSEVLHEAWNRLYNGQHIIFAGTEISLRTSVSVDAFIAHVREAWSALRFNVPTVASQVSRNEEGFVFMTYRPASSSNDIDAWAQRTVRLHTNQTPQSLDDLRYVLGTKSIPEDNGDQTFLYVLPRTRDGHFGLLIHTTHTPFDGGGIATLMNRFLAGLADCLGGHPGHAQLPWGQEVQNLLPSIPEVIGQDEPLSGADYDKTLAEILGDIITGLPRQHGFKLRTIGPGPTRRLGHKFSKVQTDRIIQRTREFGLTVNNIVNAAVLLVNAFDNPPTALTPGDAAFAFYYITDARHHLPPPYFGRGYPGCCLGVAVIQVPLSILPSNFMQSRDTALGALIKVAGALKDESARVRRHRSLLAVQAQAVDVLHAGTRAGLPLPPPWMGSWYSGDGAVERYLDAVHTNKEGTPVLDVQDIYASINMTDPGPFFRANTWKGALDISVDANEVAMPVDVIQGFVDKWVELILAFSASGTREVDDQRPLHSGKL